MGLFTCPIKGGMKSVNTFYESLKNTVKEIYLIVDAKEPRKAIEAIHEGTQADLTI